LSWLVQPEAYELLKAHPDLDEVIVWPRSEWRELWRARRWFKLFSRIREFRRELRRRGFDVAIDMQGLLKSGLLAWLSGAPERVGLGSSEGSAHLMTRVIDKPSDSVRIGSEYRHLAEALAMDTSSFEMHVAVSNEDAEEAHRALADGGIAGAYAVLCPFTTRPQKHWVEQRWVELASKLSERTDLGVVLLGGPGDVNAADRIAGESEVVVNLVGQLPVGASAAVIRDANLLIGVDTGLTHMGIAFNVPSVILFGSTCPYLDTGRDNTTIIYKDLECSPCRRNPTCNGEFTCMKLIGVDETLDKALALLQ
jgi:heptosyltransferase-1